MMEEDLMAEEEMSKWPTWKLILFKSMCILGILSTFGLIMILLEALTQ